MARKAQKNVLRTEVTYYTWEHNIEGALQNGSFVRTHIKDGKIVYVQWMNGDCMGPIDAVPKKMKQVDKALAESLIPSVCK